MFDRRITVLFDRRPAVEYLLFVHLSDLAMMSKMRELIAAAYTTELAASYERFSPAMSQLSALEAIGRDVLTNVPPIPGMCAIMTALHAARWEMEARDPIYVVAGELYAGDTRVFGNDYTQPTFGMRDEVNLSWDGHYWLCFGPYIADASLLRTARSSESPALLRVHVEKNIPPNLEMLLENNDAMKSVGLEYVPRKVLVKSEIDGLLLGGQALFQ